MLAQRSDKDPLDVLSSFVTSEVADPALRLQAAATLAQFKYGKRPAMRFISDVTGLPAPKTVEEATAYIARVIQLMAAGKLDVDGANAVIAGLRDFVDAKIGVEVAQKLEQAELLLRELEAKGITAAVRVIDGLPPLPGCSIRMPGDPPILDAAANKNPWATPDVVSVIQPRREDDPESSEGGPAA
jgi:hypothetical protein